MSRASCSLEVSEMLLTEYKNPDETNEGTPSDSSNDASSVLVELMRMESRPCSKSATAWSRKEQSLHPGSSQEWVPDDTLPMKPAYISEEKNKMPH